MKKTSTLKILGATLLVSTTLLASAKATITVNDEWNTIVSGTLTDSVGGYNFTKYYGGALVNSSTGTLPSGFSSYISFPSGGANKPLNGATSLSLPTNNFGIELYAETNSDTAKQGVLNLANFDTGSLQITFNGGASDNLVISSYNVSTLATISISTGTWYDLALVVTDSTLNVYVDGTSVYSGTLTAQEVGTTNYGNIGLGILSGGTGTLNGGVAGLQEFTFADGAFNPATDLYIAVPEPSTVVLAGIFGAGMLLLFRRVRRTV